MGARLHYWLALLLALYLLAASGCAAQPERVCMDGYHDWRRVIVPSGGLGWIETQEQFWHCTLWVPVREGEDGHGH